MLSAETGAGMIPLVCANENAVMAHNKIAIELLVRIGRDMPTPLEPAMRAVRYLSVFACHTTTLWFTVYV
jgi:hypothetical protein